MKKTILILLCSVLLLSIGHAQTSAPNGSGKQRSGKLSKKQRHKLIKDLHLTAEQKATWKASKKDFKVKQQEIKGNSTLSDIQKKEELKTLRHERLEKMRGLLTPEQIKTFQRETNK